MRRVVSEGLEEEICEDARVSKSVNIILIDYGERVAKWSTRSVVEEVKVHVAHGSSGPFGCALIG
jgi:hypothetical protein